MAAETILIIGESGRGKVKYCRLYEKSGRLLQDNIGEGCDANTEISVETKESIPS